MSKFEGKGGWVYVLFARVVPRVLELVVFLIGFHFVFVLFLCFFWGGRVTYIRYIPFRVVRNLPGLHRFFLISRGGGSSVPNSVK